MAQIPGERIDPASELGQQIQRVVTVLNDGGSVYDPSLPERIECPLGTVFLAPIPHNLVSRRIGRHNSHSWVPASGVSDGFFIGRMLDLTTPTDRLNPSQAAQWPDAHCLKLLGAAVAPERSGFITFINCRLHLGRTALAQDLRLYKRTELAAVVPLLHPLCRPSQQS